jgi:uncharacterized protein (TIRG00374 family)
LALACVICLASTLLSFIRWYFLVRAVDLPFTVVNALRLGLVGYFFNNFLPGSIGGDLVKAACVIREQNRRTVAVATVLIDRAIGLWALVWLVALLGTGFWLVGNEEVTTSASLQWAIRGSIGIVVASGLTWLLLGFLPQRRADRFARRLTRVPKVGHSLAEFWRAVWMYRCRGRSIALALALGLLGHLCNVLVFFFAVQAFLLPGEVGQIPSLVEHYIIVPIGMTAQAFFPSPGGVGFAEFSYGALYAMLGKPKSLGVLGSLAGRLIAYTLGITGYLVYLRMRPALREPPEELLEAA